MVDRWSTREFNKRGWLEDKDERVEDAFPKTENARKEVVTSVRAEVGTQTETWG